MAGKRKNFFMVDNRIFEYGLKPRDIAVYCFLCRRMNRKAMWLSLPGEISQTGAESGKRKPWTRQLNLFSKKT